jgi:hypothetical protein
MSIFLPYKYGEKIDIEQAMDVVRTNILREPWDVDRRLNEMQLTRKGLLVARDVALQESANATAFHPANAAGTFSYHHGTWALRDQFVDKKWIEDRTDSIEAIRNDPSRSRLRSAMSTWRATITIRQSIGLRRALVPRERAEAVSLPICRNTLRDRLATILCTI